MKNCLRQLTTTVFAFVSLGAYTACAELLVTIQPHSSNPGYVVTYSWKGGFPSMDGGSNGSNAYIDDNTTTVSSDYVMTSGNHSGSKIRYSQHNNNGTNGDFFTVPANGSLIAVHYDGTDGESLVATNPMRESSHANIGFTENGGDWYNNPNDYGGVRFFGTGVQGAVSLTSWNGVTSASAYGDEVYDGYTLLGGAMQFGVNGSPPTLVDSARFGLAFDAKYVNDLSTAGTFNGLVIGYFPYASTFPNVAPGPNLFTDQFNVGLYTSGANITMRIIDDATFGPLLVTEAAIPEPASLALLLAALGGMMAARRRRV